MKIQAGDYLVWHNNNTIGVFRPNPGTNLLLELHFADGSSRYKMSLQDMRDFSELAIVIGKVNDLKVTFIKGGGTPHQILKECPAFQFSDAPLYDPTL